MGRYATTTTATATASGNNLVIIASGPRRKKLKIYIKTFNSNCGNAASSSNATLRKGSDMQN